jgi:hypothetical protein
VLCSLSCREEYLRKVPGIEDDRSMVSQEINSDFVGTECSWFVLSNFIR